MHEHAFESNRRILQEAKAGNHLTALDLQQLALKRGETLHLTTVYRILHRLVSSVLFLNFRKGGTRCMSGKDPTNTTVT